MGKLILGKVLGQVVESKNKNNNLVFKNQRILTLHFSLCLHQVSIPCLVTLPGQTGLQGCFHNLQGQTERNIFMKGYIYNEKSHPSIRINSFQQYQPPFEVFLGLNCLYLGETLLILASPSRNQLLLQVKEHRKMVYGRQAKKIINFRYVKIVLHERYLEVTLVQPQLLMNRLGHFVHLFPA